ncbi:MAG: hypothetical protein ACREUN_00445 [Burkholderiales bacterium]
MIRLLLLPLLLPLPAVALSSAAQEFMRIVDELEPVHCEKRKLRREIALGQVQGHDVKPQKDRFAALSREPKTARLEKRLGELEPRVSKSSDPEDLAAISRQQKEAYYRCE